MSWGERVLEPAAEAFRNFHHGEGNLALRLDGIRVIGATRPFCGSCTATTFGEKIMRVGPTRPMGPKTLQAFLDHLGILRNVGGRSRAAETLRLRTLGEFGLD